MYTCVDCSEFFDQAYQAFVHLCTDHADAPKETKIRLEAMFEWQRLQFETINITLAEYNDLQNKAAELKTLLDAPRQPEGSIAL